MPFTSDIANCLLWTPFDNKSINNYDLFSKTTTEEFLNKCFSHPFFDVEGNREYSIDYKNTEDSDFSTTLDDVKYSMYIQSKHCKTFLNWLEQFDNNKVYTISGNSGSGKTTYIRHLEHTLKEYEWTVIDVSSRSKNITWIQDITTRVTRYSFAFRKTYAAMLRQIQKITFGISNKNGEKSKYSLIYDNLNMLINNYRERFQDELVSGSTLFEMLIKVFKENDNEKNIVIECGKVLKEYFANTDDDEDDALFDKALDALLLVLRCANKDEHKRHIIVFDNFEKFIYDDELYNSEIDAIRRNLAENAERVNEPSNHNCKFKFIMAIRCSTARLSCIRLDPADENPSDLDISSWFDINDIIFRKIQWFEENSVINPNFELTKQISGDLRKCQNNDLTGLKLFIDPLFNDNKRLIIDFIGIIIENHDNVEKFDYVSGVKAYKKNWEYNTDITRCAARNIMKGLILNKLKNSDMLFKHLKGYSVNVLDENITSGLGLSRKILTILYNHTIENNDEISLSVILSELYSTRNISADWTSDQFAKRRETLSEILYYMTSYNRRKNDWIQFIDLQYGCCGEKVLIDSKEQLEELLTEKLDDFKVTIMPAGIAYLKYIVQSFEYFAVRYCKIYKPLFMLVPTKDEMIGENINFQSFPCYKTIEFVKNQALTCISQIQDNNLKIKIKNGNLSHVERIVNSHRSYINNFIEYIRELYINNIEIDIEVRRNYQKLIDEIAILRNEYAQIRK